MKVSQTQKGLSVKITVYAGDDSSNPLVLQCTADIVQGLMLGHSRIPERFQHILDWVGIQTERLDSQYVRKVRLHVKLLMERVKVPEALLSLEIYCDSVEDSALKEKVAERLRSEVIHRLVNIGNTLEHTATWFKNAAQEKP